MTSMAKSRRDAQLAALAAMTDEEIDFSDIPETLDWSHAVTGKFYRPVKKSVSIRLDADLIEWLKAREGQYQTAVNRILREYMMAQGKGPKPPLNTSP